MSDKFCISCHTSIPQGAKFCPSCGTPAPEAPEAAAQPPDAKIAKRVMTRRARRVYGFLTIILFFAFLYVFIEHLPGKPDPVIEKQPDVAMAASFASVNIEQQQIDVTVQNGKIVFPLSKLLEKKMVSFEYVAQHATVPLLAFINNDGKLVTCIRMCEPCNSKTFRIENTDLVCGVCGTRWKLGNLEGIQGSCQKYPPAPIPSIIVGDEIQIDAATVRDWKMRI